MFKIIDSEEINHRVDFPLLCNARGVRVAFEVGTDMGGFAKEFMSRFGGESLYCVDPYVSYEWLPEDRTPDIMMAVMALMPWHGRVRFVRDTSPGIVSRLPDWLVQKIDFVYIDGQHSYTEVKKDLDAWWDVLSSQGILAGHDYDETHPGVVKAVRQFAKQNKVVLRIVKGDPIPSWYVYKEEPKVIYHRFFQWGESPNGESEGMK